MHILVVEDDQAKGYPTREPLALALRRELPESRVSEFVLDADLPDRICAGPDYDIGVLGCLPPHGRALLDRLSNCLGHMPWVILDGANAGHVEYAAEGRPADGSAPPVYYLPPDTRALVVVLRQQAEIVRLRRQAAAAAAARQAAEERFQVDAALISGYAMTLAQLSTTEERLLAQYERLPVPTYTWRRQGTDFVLVNFNDAAKEFAGPNLRKLLNRPAAEVFADSPSIAEDMALAYTEQRMVRRQMLHTMRSNGARRHLAVTYAFVPPDEVLAHTEDITARVEAEAALAYQAHLLANVSDAVVATDAQARITSWNRAAAEMYGWPAEEVLGRSVNEVLPAQWLGTDEQTLLKTLLQTDRLRAEAHVVRRDGQELVVETTVMTLRDEAGQIMGYVSVGRNITLRRKAEAERDATLAALSLREASLEQALDALRSSEALLRNVLDTLPVGVWILDRGGHLLSANPAGIRIWGGQRDMPLERFGEVKGWRLDTGEPMQAHEWAPARALLAGQAVLGQEIAVEALDGVHKIISNSSVPLRDGDGTVIGAIVVQEDITERKRAEAEIKLAHEQLQDLSRRLVNLQEDERRAVARELYDEASQLLASLMLGLGSLERAAYGPPEMRARIAELKGMTEEIMGVLHRLAVDLRPASLDKLGLMHALRQYLDAFATRTGIQAELAPLEAAEGRLPPDVETALYRILQEALANVAQHAGATHVGVAFHRRDDRVIAIVEDDGQGFNAAAGPRHGRLGLFGMRERAEMLGGTLTVESAPGAGTTLFVEIPVA